MALHMINWTIGQLGLGEVQVLGMGPQGIDKGKWGFGSIEEDMCFCLCFTRILCWLWVKSTFLWSESDGALCQYQCLTLWKTRACMCKFLQMLASQVFTSREGASESENVPLVMVKVFSVSKQNQHLQKFTYDKKNFFLFFWLLL